MQTLRSLFYFSLNRRRKLLGRLALAYESLTQILVQQARSIVTKAGYAGSFANLHVDWIVTVKAQGSQAQQFQSTECRGCRSCRTVITCTVFQGSPRVSEVAQPPHPYPKEQVGAFHSSFETEASILLFKQQQT